MTRQRHQAILLPGGVLPAMLAYPALVEALGSDSDARYKELEIYATEAPRDPAHRAEPEQFAQMLLGFWGRAEGAWGFTVSVH
jgi:hypothetical protein